jgi:hypothetical protein
MLAAEFRALGYGDVAFSFGDSAGQGTGGDRQGPDAPPSAGLGLPVSPEPAAPAARPLDRLDLRL